eukprot:6487005-Pyramimonas_sp.AAC.1
MACPPCCTTAWEIRASPVKISRKSRRHPCGDKAAACSPSQLWISSSERFGPISPTLLPPGASASSTSPAAAFSRKSAELARVSSARPTARLA